MINKHTPWPVVVLYCVAIGGYAYVMWSITNPHAPVYIKHYLAWARYYVLTTMKPWLVPPTSFKGFLH